MSEDRHSSGDATQFTDASRSVPPNDGSPFLEPAERERIEERLLYLTRRRFQFREDVAQKLVQDALQAYLAACPHYSASADHALLLMRILRGRCREHIRRQICLAAQGNAIRDVLKGVDVPAAQYSGTLDEIASRDTRKLILEVVSELLPKAAGVLRGLREKATRVEVLDVIELLGLERQTNAKNVTAYHSEIRQILARGGVRL